MAFTRRNTGPSYSDSSRQTKEPEKLKPVKPLKLSIKKIYCNSCRTLVVCHELKTDTGIQFLCNKCNLALRFKEGDTWKRVPATSK